MDFIAIGGLIRNLRKQQNIRQEELAAGIMTRENLSKIENGKQSVSKEKLDLLFNRLGSAAQVYFPYMLDEQDFEAHEMRITFSNAEAAFDTAGMECLIKAMEVHPSFQQHSSGGGGGF
ncbi:MAG: helix-turn-helix domain-containing protein, partial [Defluviitaleaceae bacterium]|nr:helix-turn-helix domain-containing protein [Defluviitaleaceae bacterium]